MGLNARQTKFAEVYTGNGTEACRVAGYKGSDNVLAQQARSLLRNPHIQAAIEKRRKATTAGHIASREERQAFWSKAMQDEAHELRDRLKASELLGRSEADFTDKLAGADGEALQFTFSMGRKGAK